MKTRYWIMILAGLVLVSLGALFFAGGDTAAIEVRCDGEVIRHISLAEDGEYTITTDYGVNVIAVGDGVVTVVEADCPGGDCTHMTLTPGGSPIVCLPHHLVISYAQNDELDGISG